MNSRDKKYKKIAKTRAKEYLRKKKTYKTKEEKRAFKIAEKLRLKEWEASLSSLEKNEAEARIKAFRTYRFRINLIRNLIFIGIALIVLLAFLIVLL